MNGEGLINPELAVAFQVLEVLPTPNPNALKFVLNARISEQTLSFLTPDSATNHPLATELFNIKGVTSILLLGDFVTINKSPAGKWPDIKRQVRKALSTKDG